MNATEPVLLFDAECGLCLRCVHLLLKTDRRGRLRFAALQGLSAQVLLRARGWPTTDFESLIFVPDWPVRQTGRLLTRSDALLAAGREAGGIWRWLICFGAVPRAWRDFVYRGVARQRQQWFGRGDARALRTRWGAERFVD